MRFFGVSVSTRGASPPSSRASCLRFLAAWMNAASGISPIEREKQALDVSCLTIFLLWLDFFTRNTSDPSVGERAREEVSGQVTRSTRIIPNGFRGRRQRGCDYSDVLGFLLLLHGSPAVEGGLNPVALEGVRGGGDACGLHERDFLRDGPGRRRRRSGLPTLLRLVLVGLIPPPKISEFLLCGPDGKQSTCAVGTTLPPLVWRRKLSQNCGVSDITFPLHRPSSSSSSSSLIYHSSPRARREASPASAKSARSRGLISCLISGREEAKLATKPPLQSPSTSSAIDAPCWLTPERPRLAAPRTLRLGSFEDERSRVRGEGTAKGRRAVDENPLISLPADVVCDAFQCKAYAHTDFDYQSPASFSTINADACNHRQWRLTGNQNPAGRAGIVTGRQRSVVGARFGRRSLRSSCVSQTKPSSVHSLIILSGPFLTTLARRSKRPMKSSKPHYFGKWLPSIPAVVAANYEVVTPEKNSN
ncbi:hypothetical protein EYF80_041121 [Liparis tanakae]|uniref:Uncharacterized protein n=1 Tax=Liparis tanakae TaxID=230148 RepID=A0A4Z2G784_9TELE|nr:hypothetical protein EYF80_041121 [Liparis tanakae]